LQFTWVNSDPDEIDGLLGVIDKVGLSLSAFCLAAIIQSPCGKMIKVEWLPAGFLPISSSVRLVNGQIMLTQNLHIRPANGNQRPVAVTNKERIVTESVCLLLMVSVCCMYFFIY
jgi:hypothetical protein